MPSPNPLPICLACLLACGSGDPKRNPRNDAENLLDTMAKRGASAAPPSGAGPLGPQLTDLAVHREGEGASSVRVVLQLSGDTPYRRTERLRDDMRKVVQLVFEGAGAAPRLLQATRAVGAGLESFWVHREGDLLAADFVLAPDARYRLFTLRDPLRFILDVERPRALPPDQAKLLVLDPGHGGEDLGSPGLHGLWEGKLTLDLSRRVKAWLARIAPQIRVRLTRDSDVYLTLEERAAMANALGADLFVSVHLNAATTRVDKGGVAAFVLDIGNDRNVLRLAARENGTRTSEVSPLQFLVGSIARTEQQRASLAAATLIQRGTLFSSRRMLPKLADRGVKSAMFYVLVGAQMPAVLVEASFITQPDEARALTLATYREMLAEGMARGIAKVLSAR